jgi:Domain of unknown function (DUF4349)
MKTRSRPTVVMIGMALLCLTSCAKKLESPAELMKVTSEDLAVTQRAADNTLAYEHEVSLEIDREQIAQRVDATRAACVADTKSACAILEVEVSDQGVYAGGHVKMRLAPSGVDAIVELASTDADVTDRETRAEDLAQPLADVTRQLSMLNAYRERLTGLLARKDTTVTDLISVSKELAATQTQIEQLSSENAQLRRRIDTDLLTISWQVPAAQRRSADTPVSDALRAFGANFREAIGSVIEFLAHLVPWLVIGLPSLVLLRVFWRWSGNWLSRRVRTS